MTQEAVGGKRIFLDSFFNAMNSEAPLWHRFDKCWCRPCDVTCFDQRSPDHTSDALDALILHFAGRKHRKGLVEALGEGKEHVQTYRNWQGDDVQFDHKSGEVWLGGKKFWSPRLSGTRQVNWSLWQRMTNNRLEAAGKAPKTFKGPSDFGNGAPDVGVSPFVAIEQSPGSGSGAPSKSMQGQTEIQPQDLCNVLKKSLTMMRELYAGVGNSKITFSSALSRLERAQLHQEAARLGLKTRSRGPAETRIMHMWRVERGNARSRSPRQTETDPRRRELGELTFTALVSRAISDGIEATTIDSCETSDSLTKYKAAIIDLILDKNNWGIWGSPPSLHRGPASASIIR